MMPRQVGATRFITLLHAWLMVINTGETASILFTHSGEIRRSVVDFITREIKIPDEKLRKTIADAVVSISGYSPIGKAYNYVLGDCLIYNKNFKKDIKKYFNV